jgi:hypothetical protein
MNPTGSQQRCKVLGSLLYLAVRHNARFHQLSESLYLVVREGR